MYIQQIIRLLNPFEPTRILLKFLPNTNRHLTHFVRKANKTPKSIVFPSHSATKLCNNIFKQSSFPFFSAHHPLSGDFRFSPKTVTQSAFFLPRTRIKELSGQEKDEERNLLFISVLLATPASLSVFPSPFSPFNSRLISYFSYNRTASEGGGSVGAAEKPKKKETDLVDRCRDMAREDPFLAIATCGPSCSSGYGEGT